MLQPPFTTCNLPLIKPCIPHCRIPVGFQSYLFVWLRNRVLNDSWWDACYPWMEWVEIKLMAWVAATKAKVH